MTIDDAKRREDYADAVARLAVTETCLTRACHEVAALLTFFRGAARELDEQFDAFEKQQEEA